MKISKVRIADIIPYEYNAKLHPKEQIEQIKNSIREFGNNDPIAVDENNVIIEGHGRYEALRSLDYDEIDVIVLEGLSEEQKKAYRIVHNQLTMNSGWDMDTLKAELSKIDLNLVELGIDESLLNEVEEELKEATDDNFEIDFDETPSIVRKGDVWQLGNHRLMCGDSTDKSDVGILMSDVPADLLVTDPPYNINISNSQGMTIENDNMERSEFLEFLKKAMDCADSVMKEGASFYIWYADTSAVEFHRACPWQIRENLIWVKNQFIMGRQDYHWRHEPCLYGWKDGAAHYFINDRKQSTVIDDSIDLETANLKEYVKQLFDYSTVLYEKKPTVNDLHPTMKPIPLIGRLVKNSSRSGEIVLDLFGGSGSTLIACEQLGRECRIMEYDVRYADVIIKRWEDFTGKKAVLLNGEERQKECV